MAYDGSMSENQKGERPSGKMCKKAGGGGVGDPCWSLDLERVLVE